MQFSDHDLLVVAKNSLADSHVLSISNKVDITLSQLQSSQSIAASLLLIARKFVKDEDDKKHTIRR